MSIENHNSLEIERKFLIELPENIAAREGCRACRIVQTYLKSNGCERRIREITEIIGGEYGKTSYFYTEKRTPDSADYSGKAAVRVEDEREITREEYDSLMSERYSGLSKTRYSFPFAGHIIEIDVYPYEYGGEGLVGRAVMEIELNDADEEIALPEEIVVLRELTGTREFSNKAMAKRLV